MEFGAYLTFALLAFSMTAAPGPNLFLVLHHASGGSMTHAGAAIAGICFSLIIHAALALFGLSILLTANPIAFSLIKLVGATYVVYLGIQALFAYRQRSVSQVCVNDGSFPKLRPLKAFKDGFFVGVFNPYTGIFILTVTPQFLVSSNTPLAAALGFLIATIALIKILWFGSIAMVLAKLSALIKSRAFSRYLNLFSGVVLVTLGAELMLGAIM